MRHEQSQPNGAKGRQNSSASAGYCQVDVEWTKLAPAKPSGRPELLYEGSTGRIAPRGEGVIAGRPVLTGGQTMAAELEVVVDLSVN